MDPISTDRYTLYLGDCLDWLPTLAAGSIDAVITDPPYGIDHDTDYTRFSGGLSPSRNWHRPIAGDDTPFDPTPWLDFPKVVLFGFNCFSDRLPQGSILIWCKRRDSQLGKFMSDCELAWMKGGHGVYLFHHVWNGFDRESERGRPILHPSQKPVAVMRWAIEKQRLRPGATILDPYMGSGSTGVAALELGYRFIGIEQDTTHFATAQRQLAAVQPALLSEVGA